MITNEYDVTIVRVVDGDTIDVDIDLGFNVCLKNQRIRIMGIDTPECRTSDPVEKLFGLAAKQKVENLLENKVTLITTENKHGDDERGKFGRILGDFRTKEGYLLTEILINDGYCVAYFGGGKDEIKQKHLNNRKLLLEKGLVNRNDYNTLIQ